MTHRYTAVRGNSAHSRTQLLHAGMHGCSSCSVQEHTHSGTDACYLPASTHGCSRPWRYLTCIHSSCSVAL